MSRNFQEALFEQLQSFLEVVSVGADGADGMRPLFATVGWDIDNVPDFPTGDATVAFAAFKTALDAFATGSLTPQTFDQVRASLEASAAVVTALNSIGNALNVSEPEVRERLKEFPADLLNFLGALYLRERHPLLYELGFLLTYLKDQELTPVVRGNDGYARAPIEVPRLALGQLIPLVRDPVGHLKAEYGLVGGIPDQATADQVADKLFPRMQNVLGALGIVSVYGTDPAIPTDYGTEGTRLAQRMLTVFVPILDTAAASSVFVLTLSLDPVLGVVLRPQGAVSFADSFGRWQVGLALQAAAEGLAVDASGVTFPSAAGAGSAFTASLTAAKGPTIEDVDGGSVGPAFLVGSPQGTRLEIGQFSVNLNASFSASRRDFGFLVEVGQAALIMKNDGDDGFLGKLLPNDGPVQFDLGFGWSSQRGLQFKGSASLEVDVPVTISLGPIEVRGVHLGIAADTATERINLEVSGSFLGHLGPVSVSVERVGALVALSFPETGGSLGPIDADLEVKPPTGVGIAIDAGPVSGGGFISFKDGRYAGALELKIYSVAVKAFGVIDTKFPDGSKGFSFVIIISAEFTPIQLGLGFTLLGVGGLVGINRRVDAEALRNAVREGNLENVLFPTNVVARAPEIIRDLTALFPATEGRYLFGPMARIGWGTPTLIRADLGIILELPGPILSILGEVRCTLPSEDAALIKLNLTVAGQLNFPEKSFELFAALHDSVIAGFAVKGQMAMRLRWGQKPVFALAVGGFHPAFTPPPKFPTLQPMTVDLGRNGNPGITLSGFFAITSNTAQVGGTLALRASGAGVTLEASISVKAIFVFSPFAFEAVIDASVRVSFHGYGIGVRLHGTLSGPSPWRVVGKVCVSVLWWDACLSFQKSFGGGKRVELPTINPFTGTEKALGAPEDIPGLEDAIKDPRSWEPVTPAGVFAVVSLARASDDKPPFDPMGGLSMRQKVLPLETAQAIKRFGVAKAENPRVFSLGSAIIGATTPLQITRVLTDQFAPGQFFEMEAHHKLSAPSFEEQGAGYSFKVNADDALAGSVANKVVAYTTRVVDTRPLPPPPPPPRPPGDYKLPDTHLVGMLKRSAGGLFGVGRLGDLRYVNPDFKDPFGFKTPKYVSASKSSLRQNSEIGATTKTEALLTFDLRSLADPSKVVTLQVVPDYEALAPLP